MYVRQQAIVEISADATYPTTPTNPHNPYNTHDIYYLMRLQSFQNVAHEAPKFIELSLLQQTKCPVQIIFVDKRCLPRKPRRPESASYQQL